jgi:hypothetical protein
VGLGVEKKAMREKKGMEKRGRESDLVGEEHTATAKIISAFECRFRGEDVRPRPFKRKGNPGKHSPSAARGDDRVELALWAAFGFHHLGELVLQLETHGAFKDIC